jgi:hypothetical protein
LKKLRERLPAVKEMRRGQRATGRAIYLMTSTLVDKSISCRKPPTPGSAD